MTNMGGFLYTSIRTTPPLPPDPINLSCTWRNYSFSGKINQWELDNTYSNIVFQKFNNDCPYITLHHVLRKKVLFLLLSLPDSFDDYGF